MHGGGCILHLFQVLTLCLDLEAPPVVNADTSGALAQGGAEGALHHGAVITTNGPCSRVTKPTSVGYDPGLTTPESGKQRSSKDPQGDMKIPPCVLFLSPLWPQFFDLGAACALAYVCDWSIHAVPPPLEADISAIPELKVQKQILTHQ